MPGGVHNEIVCPAMFSVPPMPMDVGMVRTSLPLSKTVTSLVASSATDTCESPIRNNTRLSSCPNMPFPSDIP
ncbi:Uncharacterised protein [Mycobacterium tuberculosis]|nr:Uncharacterised protein [Mycobacterium tuberculosis]